jgi:hypothetical protein
MARLRWGYGDGIDLVQSSAAAYNRAAMNPRQLAAALI